MRRDIEIQYCKDMAELNELLKEHLHCLIYADAFLLIAKVLSARFYMGHEDGYDQARLDAEVGLAIPLKQQGTSNGESSTA